MGCGLNALTGVLSPKYNVRFEADGISGRPVNGQPDRQVYDLDFFARVHTVPNRFQSALSNNPIVDRCDSYAFIIGVECALRDLKDVLTRSDVYESAIDFALTSRDFAATLAARRAGWHSILTLGHEHYEAGTHKHLAGEIHKIWASDIFDDSTKVVNDVENVAYDVDDIPLWRPPGIDRGLGSPAQASRRR